MKQFTRRVIPGRNSLGRRIMVAGGWSVAQVFASHFLRLTSNLIMTRLLAPDAFGLMAMVGVVITGFTLFTDIGISRSVVREPDGDQDHFLRVVWVLKICRGAAIALAVLVTAGAIWAAAPAIAPEESVYADARLPGLIALSALFPLLMGTESATRELAERRLKLQYLFGLEVVSQSLKILAMVAFVWISPTVWALMAGMLISAVLRSIGTHMFFPGPRMQIVWDMDVGARLWHYGKWLMGSSIFTFIGVNADRFILGAILNAATFGIYVIAQIWVSAGAMVINRLGDQVGFPAISESIRTRPEKVPTMYRQFQSVIDIVCIVSFLILFVFGQRLINLLYTQTYTDAGGYLTILSVSFLAVRLNTLNMLIMNLGNSRAIMLISVIRAVVIYVSLPLAYNMFGIQGVLLAVALNPLVTAPYALALLRPVLGNRQLAIDWAWIGMTLLVSAWVAIVT